MANPRLVAQDVIVAVDNDIEGMALYELYDEILKLRKAIRKHRDQHGDDRCWMDDIELYEILPEGANPSFIDLRLMPRDEMLKNCECFVSCRTTELTPEAAIEKYKKEKSNEHWSD